MDAMNLRVPYDGHQKLSVPSGKDSLEYGTINNIIGGVP